MGRGASQLLGTEASRLMLNPTRWRFETGITMLELMMTLFILAIVLALGMPATARWVRQSDIRSSAENLRSALQKARAEAIARNMKIYISFGDPKGIPQWTIGCVTTTTLCPGNMYSQAPTNGGRIRWGGARAAAAVDTSAALAVGTDMPGNVEFHPLGNAPKVVSGTDTARIDVFSPGDSSAGRLVVRIDGAGNVSICDPGLPDADIRRCR